MQDINNKLAELVELLKKQNEAIAKTNELLYECKDLLTAIKANTTK